MPALHRTRIGCGPAVSYTHLDVYKRQEWGKEQLIRDLREEWGIVDEEPDEGDEDVENSDDAVVMRVGNMMLIVTLFHGHIPDNDCLLYTSRCV